MKSMRTHLYRLGISSLLISNLLSFEYASASALKCSDLFSPQTAPLAAATGNESPSEQIDKTINELSALRLNLDQAISNGSSSIAISALNSDYLRKEKALIEYIDQHKIMTRVQLIEKMRQEIQKIQGENSRNISKDEQARRSRREHEEMIKSTVIDGSRAVMHRVAPGSFKMGDSSSTSIGVNTASVNITKPFDMMATPTTQVIWRKVADLAANKFPGKYQINADPSNFKGDTHPVEQVSYDDVQVWLKALNELSTAGEPALADLIPDHKMGDVYRLPTEAEWEFVIRGRGQYNDTYHFGSDNSLLDKYGWYEENSGKQTHPVAQKKPLVVDGNEFYDMNGNVWEWAHDWSDRNLPGGTNPQGPQQGEYRVIRGGGWSSLAVLAKSGYRGAKEPDHRQPDVGFRFVRNAR